MNAVMARDIVTVSMKIPRYTAGGRIGGPDTRWYIDGSARALIQGVPLSSHRHLTAEIK